MRYLSAAEARDFYSRVGRWQDTQAFYERRPVSTMLEHGRFGDAHSVIEFGCGTGKLARELMTRLPSDARYVGVDVSPEMVRLTSDRLRPWEGRASARQSDGAMRLPVGSGACDRVVSTYVFDLLSPDDALAATREAARALIPGGLLCLVSLTPGPSGLARFVSAAWTGLWRRWPSLLGGCRPVQLNDVVQDGPWAVEHRSTVVSFGIASEVLVVRRLEGKVGPSDG